MILDHTYALTFTPKILNKIKLGLRSYKVSGSVDDVLKTGKYVKLKYRDGWWAQLARAVYCHHNSTEAQDELKEAWQRNSYIEVQTLVGTVDPCARDKKRCRFLVYLSI